MGLFNFIETFFFISLGITFVLILLLVYHFKQRMSTLEQKGDTMFEIINNIVEELTSIKREILKNTFNSKTFFPQMPSFSLSTLSSETSEPVVSNLSNPSNISYHKLEPVVEEDNENESESESESEGENESESEQDDNDYDSEEGDEGDEGDDDDSFSDSEEDTDHEVNNEPEEDVIFDEVLTEVEPENTQEKDADETSKLVMVHLDETVLTDEKHEEPEAEQQEVEADIVHKFEETGVEDKETYRKMTIHQLKVIVLAKGLSTDVGKLKKNELIRILESSHE